VSDAIGPIRILSDVTFPGDPAVYRVTEIMHRGDGTMSIELKDRRKVLMNAIYMQSSLECLWDLAVRAWLSEHPDEEMPR